MQFIIKKNRILTNIKMWLKKMFLIMTLFNAILPPQKSVSFV